MKKIKDYLHIFLLFIAALVLLQMTKIYKIPKIIKHKYTASHQVPTQNEKLLTVYPLTEKKPIVVVITSYNNEKYCEKNLHSVFEQTYDNYRVIYVDDCSTDNTYRKVKELIAKEGQEERVTLIHNDKRQSKFPNIYHAFHSCTDHEIIATLDGDDWLSDPFVLEKINKYYQNPDVWLTFGTAIIHPHYVRRSGRAFNDKTLKKGTMRDEKNFEMSMLRTFYAGLFKQIKLKDFFHNGKFMPTADDPAFMYPMVEMAPMHQLFIPEVTYVINDTNPIREQNTMGQLQAEMLQVIFKRAKYKPLDDSFHPCNAKSTSLSLPVDLVVFSDDNPLFLISALENYQRYLRPLETITVIYKASNEEYKAAYKEISSNFQGVAFINDNELSLEHLMKKLQSSQKGTSPYIAFATDEFLFEDSLNLMSCVESMDRTGAVNFFIGHGNQTTPSGELLGDFIATDIQSLIKIPELRQDSFFCLFRKEDVKETLVNKEFKTKGFMETLLRRTQNNENISLFHEKKKTKFLATPETRFAFNKAARLKKFLQGYRIDPPTVCMHPEGGIRESDFIKI